MELAYVILQIFIFMFGVVSLLTTIKKSGAIKQRRKLPPGSMGLPYVGETFKIYKEDPNTFFTMKQKRHGEIFKTRLLGYPCVLLANPEAAKFVLVTHAHLFKPTYPRSKEKLIGPSALFFHEGRYHAQLRKIVQGSLSPISIRKLVSGIESIAISALESWSDHTVPIYAFIQFKKYSFDVAILSIFGHLENFHRSELINNYLVVEKGYNSLPVRIQGTCYYRALKVREQLGEIIRSIIRSRREGGSQHNDMLDDLLNLKDENGQSFTEDQVVDNIIGVLFAAQDTTSSSLTWILKYLNDSNDITSAVTDEQIGIYVANDCGKKCLTWEQTKSMPFTNKVILESLRMASIISFTFREAATDIDYKGYTIPRGWKVMPLFRSVHYNQQFFSDPHVFDPSRFEVPPKPNSFLPFGTGTHACPGSELAKLEMLILIHHLVTKYRWEVVGPTSEIQYSPFPIPRDGMPIRIWKCSAPNGTMTAPLQIGCGQ